MLKTFYCKLQSPKYPTDIAESCITVNCGVISLYNTLGCSAIQNLMSISCRSSAKTPQIQMDLNIKPGEVKRKQELK